MKKFDEKYIQNLITNFPWILNVNFEKVPEFQNKGKEVFLRNSTRIDLVLKDRISNRPVFVEFKAVPFYRENIGQILEYRSQATVESTDEDSQLFQVFGRNIYSPILVLVVSSCSDDARIACNLAGISVYEYENEDSKLFDYKNMLSTQALFEELEKSPLPINEDRPDEVSKVYDQIFSLMSELNCEQGWKNYRKPAGEYHDSINHTFINKWIFADNTVSIGIYEWIYDRAYLDKICIEFCSFNKEAFTKFMRLYNRSVDVNDRFTELEDYGDYFGSYLVLDKSLFLGKVGKVLKPILERYLDALKSI